MRPPNAEMARGVTEPRRRSHMCQHVPACTRRFHPMHRTDIVLGILETARTQLVRQPRIAGLMLGVRADRPQMNGYRWLAHLPATDSETAHVDCRIRTGDFMTYRTRNRVLV
jgi:hypothetical protein